MAEERARYSILFWPSLYSRRTILCIPFLVMALGGLILVPLQIYREKERTLVTKTEERLKAVIALKLSGVESWQWKKELRCSNHVADCLAVSLSFKANDADKSYSVAHKAPAACNICHAAILEKSPVFYATFSAVAAIKQPASLYPVIIPAFFCIGLAIAGLLLSLKRRRIRTGICIAALSIIKDADGKLSTLVSRIKKSSRAAYYAEGDAKRLRFATTPEKMRALIEENATLFGAEHTHLKLVALHADLKKGTILPIETLRGIFQVLAQTPPGLILIHEPLCDTKDTKVINMRRLVFKNKSGASLKFVSWEPS